MKSILYVTSSHLNKMEFDNLGSVPCLLDELEDQGVIKTDIDFGMWSKQEGAVKGSPSHESDSGVSDMVDLENDLRSVSPSSDGLSEVGSTANLFDFDFSSELIDDDLDAELASYFEKPEENDSNDTMTVNLQSDAVTNATSNSSVRKSPETDIDVESDSSDHASVQRRKTLTPKRHVKFSANADVHILPSTSKCDIPAKPSVKVVKVIKTPASTTNAVLDNQVIKAIDDRNKKNAVQAKINREKKKAYIRSLEEEIDSLKMENYAVKNSNKKIVKERDALLEEVEYLKGIIANQSVLSGLLQNIGNVDNVKLTSSFMQRKRNAELDHDYGACSSAKRVKSTKTTAGVCLHVDKGNVSLEFCSKCAGMAQSTFNDDKS